jgi:pyrroline-5-carboxylate reductase
MKIGFVGAGNMGGAIIRGYAAGGAADGSDELFVYDSDAAKTAEIAAAVPSARAADSLAGLAEHCDALVICVKPNIMDAVLDELAELGVCGTSGQDGRLIISIAAGVSISHITEKLGAGARVVRVMPNTPAMVGEGMSAMSGSPGLSEADKAAAEKLFSAVGKVLWAPEELMDIVTGISGSSPAYAYLYIEGLIRAGMEGGLDKEAATILAAQSTLGAAKMVLENLGKVDPQQLCVNVCSPGGTTIEAVKVLEAEGFTGIVSKAAGASAAKSKLMTR